MKPKFLRGYILDYINKHWIACLKTMASHLSAPHSPLTHLHSQVMLWSYSWDVNPPFDILWDVICMAFDHKSPVNPNSSVQLWESCQRQEIFGS